MIDIEALENLSPVEDDDCIFLRIISLANMRDRKLFIANLFKLSLRGIRRITFSHKQNLNFRFVENNLNGKILVEKDFYRNVEIKSSDNFYADLPDEKRDGYSCGLGQFGDSSAKKIKRYIKEYR